MQSESQFCERFGKEFKEVKCQDVNSRITIDPKPREHRRFLEPGIWMKRFKKDFGIQ